MTKNRLTSGNSFKEDLISLLNKYDENIMDLEKQMGVSEEWKSELLWS